MAGGIGGGGSCAAEGFVMSVVVVVVCVMSVGAVDEPSRLGRFRIHYRDLEIMN